MNPKIERVCKDIDKTKGKIGELQARLRELERQKTKLENTEIVETVRGMDISLADLAAMLRAAHTTDKEATKELESPNDWRRCAPLFSWPLACVPPSSMRRKLLRDR